MAPARPHSKTPRAPDTAGARDDHSRWEFAPGEPIGPPPPRRTGASILGVMFLLVIAGGGGWALLDPAALTAVRWPSTSLIDKPQDSRLPPPPTPPANSVVDAGSAHSAAPLPVAAAPSPGAATLPPPAINTPPAGPGVAYAPPEKSPQSQRDDGLRKRAIEVGLHPDLSLVVLARLSETDYRNAGVAIKTALAKTPDEDALVWPPQRKPEQALFKVHFVPGAAPDCRRYVVTIVKDGWTTTALPMERCGLQAPAAAATPSRNPTPSKD